MSTSAIKSYLNIAKQHKNVSLIKKKVEKEQPKLIVNEEILRNAYEMVKMWDGSIDELVSRYQCLSDSEYKYLLENRDGLSFDIKSILWPEEFIPRFGRNSTLKVRELTEEGYRRHLLDVIRQRERLIDERISSTIIPSMPVGYLDEYSNNLTQMLTAKEKELEIIKKKIDTGMYMTPSKRDSVIDKNPDIINIRKVIQNIKNELEKTDQRLKTLNNDWERNEKFILRHKIEQELIMSGL